MKLPKNRNPNSVLLHNLVRTLIGLRIQKGILFARSSKSKNSEEVRGLAAHGMTPTCSAIDMAAPQARLTQEIAEWYHFEDKNQLKATSRWWRARRDI